MTPDECAVLIGVVRELWPNGWRSAPTTPDQLEVTVGAWLLVLDDLDLDVLIDSARRLATTSRFAPGPGELRREALGLHDAPTVDEAWSAVMALVRQHGYVAAWADDWTGCPAGLHPMVERIVLSIGWATICGSDNQVALRAHFDRWYSGALTAEVDRLVAPASLARPALGDGPTPELTGGS